MPFGLWMSLSEIEERIRTGDPKSVAYALSKSARWVVNAGPIVQDNPRKEDCIALLAPLLDSDEENVRANTLHALWYIAMSTPINLSVLKSVATRLKDHSSEVRRNAAMVLANWPDVTISDELLASLRDPDMQVRGACAAGLARLHDTRALDIIEQIVQSGEEWIGGDETLEMLFPPDRLVQLYISMLKKGNIYAGLNGLYRMVMHPDRQAYTTPAIRPLVNLLGRPVPQYAWEPARILALMRDDQAAEELLYQLSKERDTGIRSTLLSIISQLKVPTNPRLIQAQREILANEGLNLELRIAAAERLIEAGQTRTAETLLTILRTPELRGFETDREAQKIGDLIAVCGLDYLLEPLLDLATDAFVERGALCALGGYADPRAITTLINRISKCPDPRNAPMAAMALGRIYQREDLTIDMRRLIEANRRLVVYTAHTWVERDIPERTNEEEWQSYVHGAWSKTGSGGLKTYYLEDFLSGN